MELSVFCYQSEKIRWLSWLFLLMGLLDGTQSITNLMTTSGSLQVWNPDVGLLMLAIYFVSIGSLMVYCNYRDQDK